MNAYLEENASCHEYLNITLNIKILTHYVIPRVRHVFIVIVKHAFCEKSTRD